MQGVRGKAIKIINLIKVRIKSVNRDASKAEIILGIIIVLLVGISFRICLTDGEWFGWNRDVFFLQLKIYGIAKSVLYLLLVWLWSSIVISIYKLIKKHKSTRAFLHYFIPYFTIMLFVLLLVYPGIFKGDEFYVINDCYLLKIEHMQHYIIDLLYLVCLIIYPEMITITLVFVTIISIIIAKTMRDSEVLFKNKKLVWLFYIPLLFLPVIDNNLFPLRNSIIVYLFIRLLLLVYIFSKYKKKKVLLDIIILSAIISALKTEFLYLVFIIPIAIKIISNTKMKNTIAMFLVIVILTKIINIPQGKGNRNTYVFTAIFNPLSNIIADDNCREIAKEDIDNINKVTDFEMLWQKASYINIPGYYSRKTELKVSDEDKKRFLISASKIILNNIDIFFKSRFITFWHTSGMVKDYINHTGHENSNWSLDLVYVDGGIITKKAMKKTDPPLGYDLRTKVISFINCRDYTNYNQTTFLFPFVYNVIPQIIMMIIVLLVSIIKKRTKMTVIAVIVLFQFPIIFLTAPAAFWMYYMPLYMSGNIIMTFLCASYLDKKGVNK